MGYRKTGETRPRVYEVEVMTCDHCQEDIPIKNGGHVHFNVRLDEDLKYFHDGGELDVDLCSGECLAAWAQRNTMLLPRAEPLPFVHDPRPFEEFALSLTAKGRSAIAPPYLARALKLSLPKLAQLLRLECDGQLYAGQGKTQERMGEVLNVLGAAFAICGSVEKAIAWFMHSPLAPPARSAFMLMSEGYPHDALIRHIKQTAPAPDADLTNIPQIAGSAASDP